MSPYIPFIAILSLTNLKYSYAFRHNRESETPLIKRSSQHNQNDRETINNKSQKNLFNDCVKHCVKPGYQSFIASFVAGITFPLQSLTITHMKEGVCFGNVQKALFPFKFNNPRTFAKGYTQLALSRSSQVFSNSIGMFYGATIGSLLASLVSKDNNTQQLTSIFCASSLGMVLSIPQEKHFILKAANLPQAPASPLFLLSVFCRESLLATALLNSNSLTPQATLGIGITTSLCNSAAIAAMTNSVSRQFLSRSIGVIPLRALYIYLASNAQTTINNHLKLQ
ncbi:hypothetical protein CL657_01120 [bacterium]|nr:hypothetical protein [bacterium]|tara:strand:- start:683 stop:1528 length:846 start_codon:yes stop_codon:yes gene_type:complete